MTIFQISNLQNINLLLVGITIAAIGILGFAIFFNNHKSVTTKAFLFFSLITIFYGTANYLNYQVTPPHLVLWFLRLTIFFAVWHAFSFFQLFYVFPQTQQRFSRKYKFILLPLVIITSILTLTPLVFSGIEELGTSGEVSRAKHEPGILSFVIMIVFLVGGGIFLLTKKTIRAAGSERNQFLFVALGTLITFSFIVVFNFVLPIAFNNVQYLPLASVFFLPFILFTGYSIIKYRLFNIKILATSILVLVLTIIMLFEVLFATDLGVLVFKVSIFLLVLAFGILLIRSVHKEVEQREELEVLTKRLEDANEQLKKLDKAKSEFVSIASHQLRTPLTAIKGYVSLVLEGTYGQFTQGVKKPLENIFQSNERLIKLVNDLLSISRIESGRLDMEWKHVKLEAVIKSVIQELQVKSNAKNLTLTFREPKSRLPILKLDEAKIRNAILNIIDNAIRYTDEGGITVITGGGIDTPKIRIEIHDTGAGMSEVELEKLFQSFTRGSAGATRWTDGAGLGLYIARQFVKAQGGKVWAESDGKGRGSTFIIELPNK